MFGKRKRSDSQASLSSGSTVAASPSRAGGAGAFDFMETEQQHHYQHNPFAPHAHASTPAHLPSRTLKRFRDNRPSDAEVHQHTLHLLYSARDPHHRQQPAAAVQPSPHPAQNQSRPHASAPVAALPPSRPDARQQPSLHSFWNLPGCAATSAAPSPPVPRESSCCEDCGAALAGDGSGDDAMMDVDDCGIAGQDHGCGACGKVVCFSCSVSNLGEDRRCLGCADRKVWVGGIGWTNAGVSVC